MHAPDTYIHALNFKVCFTLAMYLRLCMAIMTIVHHPSAVDLNTCLKQ